MYCKMFKPLPLYGQSQQMTNCNIFLIFYQKTGFDISGKLMKYQNLVTWENKKNISVYHLLKILPSMLSRKL